LGAAHIILLNVLPIEKLPKFYSIPAKEKRQLDDMTKQYNKNLLHSMDILNQGGQNSHQHILHYDVYTHFAEFCKNMKGSPESCNQETNCQK
jgi:hypothetical protein